MFHNEFLNQNLLYCNMQHKFKCVLIAPSEKDILDTYVC